MQKMKRDEIKGKKFKKIPKATQHKHYESRKPSLNSGLSYTQTTFGTDFSRLSYYVMFSFRASLQLTENRKTEARFTWSMPTECAKTYAKQKLSIAAQARESHIR